MIKRRRFEFHLITTGMLALALLLTACGGEVTPASFGLAFVVDSLGGHGPDRTKSAGRGDRSRESACVGMPTDPSASHFLPDTTVAFLSGEGYFTWCIPEYHDVQAFRLHGATYGPVAYSFASPTSSFYESHTSYDAYFINVAIVDVGLGSITAPAYNHLNLTNGHNCVFLTHRHTGSTAKWFAVVGPPVSGTCFGAGTGPDARMVPVEAEQWGTAPDKYPPVTRFVEAKSAKGGASGPPLTFLGVRCGNAWCNIGHGGGATPNPSTHSTMAGTPTTVRWTVTGWSDDQHWAVPDGAGLKPHTESASIVPVEELASITETQFTSDWVHVADVNVPGTVPDKYKTGYDLRDAATTMVWIRRYPPAGRGGQPRWFARFGPDPHVAGIRSRHVDWTDHSGSSYQIPATARWRWSPADEEIWVECLVGCCMVTRGPVDPGDEPGGP